MRLDDRLDPLTHRLLHDTGTAFGVLDYVSSTTPEDPFTVPADIPGLTTDVVVRPNRLIKITALLHAYSTVTTDRLVTVIFRDGTQIQYGVALRDGALAIALDRPVAGSHTYKVQLQEAAGNTGDYGLWADTTEPMYLLVEDIGPA